PGRGAHGRGGGRGAPPAAASDRAPGGADGARLLRDQYAAGGRPGLDPVVFFQLQLILFFEGLRSERRLIATASVHLAHRWYLGYALDEPLPDHSTLSPIRQRLGLEGVRRLLGA